MGPVGATGNYNRPRRKLAERGKWKQKEGGVVEREVLQKAGSWGWGKVLKRIGETRVG